MGTRFRSENVRGSPPFAIGGTGSTTKSFDVEYRCADDDGNGNVDQGQITSNAGPSGKYQGRHSVTGGGSAKSTEGHVLHLPRRQPRKLPQAHLGSSYSNKMTLRCKPSLSSKKRNAKKITASTSQGQRLAVSQVRCMLPWRQNAPPPITDTNQESLSNLMGQPSGVAAETRAGSHTAPKIALQLEDESASRHVCGESAMTASISSCREEGGEKSQKKATGGERSFTINPGVGNTTLSRLETSGTGREHNRSNDYVHYLHLFENPPPSIPTLDQYIFDDSITYEAIAKRGHRKALPLNPSVRGIFGMHERGGAPVGGGNGPHGAGYAELEAHVNPSALLYADEDIDKLLSFFDAMGVVDGRVTLEEMTAGFRRIRREWATVKAEKAGRAVLAKVVRLIGRAGMTLEEWFRFMDTSESGHRDGKLTALKLRSGFERLVTQIARQECYCRAYKCSRTPKYGIPVPRADARGSTSAKVPAAGVDATEVPSSVHFEEADGGHQGNDEGRRASHDALHCATKALGENGAVAACHTSSAVVMPPPVAIGDRDTAESPRSDDDDDCGAEVGNGWDDESSRGSAVGLQEQEQRAPHYGGAGTQVLADAGDSGPVGDGITFGHGRQDLHDGVTDASTGRGGGGDGDKSSVELPALSEVELEDRGKDEGLNHCFEGAEEGAMMARPKGAKSSATLSTSGIAIACREHALAGMVYLGRTCHMGLKSEKFSSKEISDLMRFIDTDVNFALDIHEMRRAISRLQADDVEADRRCREPGALLEVLEQHMHRTGGRFTDIFFLLDRDRSGYIDKKELRTLFETLSREPERRKARARARAEHAKKLARVKEMRETEAREASMKLDLYKKAGVYSVLKRIQVWQARTGKRLSDVFHGGTEDGAGSRGLDLDELAAFVRSLGLDLSPSESMLVLRHLDGGNNGLVEVNEVAAAVRNIRRYEAIIKAAQEHHAGVLPGASFGEAVGGGAQIRTKPMHGVGDRRRQLAGGGTSDYQATNGHGCDGGRGAWDDAGYRLDFPGMCGPEGYTSSLEKLLPVGPAVFRPPMEIITHRRALSAPARGGRTNNGASGTTATTTTTTTRRPLTTNASAAARAAIHSTVALQLMGGTFRGGGLRDASRFSGDGQRPLASLGSKKRLGQGATSWPMCATGTADNLNATAAGFRDVCRGRPSPRSAPDSIERGGSKSRSSRLASVEAEMEADDAQLTYSERSLVRKELPPWEIGLRKLFEGSGGWWPSAESAVEEGARLEIYTGSVLDGKWLNSLDSRLRATMRATRR